MANSEAGTNSDVAQTSGGEYQVFLSFKGSDTRHGFADFLYHGLIDSGVYVFKEDDELPIEKVIGERLLHAINNSMLYIPIFSQTYASSKRCLQELALIVDNVSQSEDQKSILPIFFDVEHEDVKLRTPLYSTAFEKYNEDYPKEVEAWRKALAEVDEIKGWNVKKDQSQAAIVKSVVEKVLEKLEINRKSVTEHLIGLDAQVKHLIELLDVNSPGVRLIGIYGKGGIGKTTIAKVIFNKLSFHFGKCCSFLENIRESSLTKEGIVQLQRKLLSDIVGSRFAEQLMDSEQAMRRIGDTLGTRSVLVVLDDVDKKEHIKKLTGGYSLHSGSRIIITTRNKIVLNVKGLKDEILCYGMLKMDDAPALRLFCQHAFGREFPSDIYDGFSSKIVSIIGGLPLAIEVIGSLLYGKDEAFWKETLVRLREAPEEDIMETLRISYDNLDKYQQQIFLDIACFLFNENKTDAIYMWADCQFYPMRGLKVLTDRCLIKILDNDKIWMHDQLKELGRRIVRQESPFNPGKCSRLWIAQEALEIIRTKKRKDEIQALKIFGSVDSIEITNEEFERLQNLRFLELHRGTYVGDFARCHSNLRWFSWHSPQEFRAANMFLDHLIVCKLDTVDFKDGSKAWDLIKRAQNLKVLSITRCSSITTIPDFSKCLYLQRLTLANCFNLERIESFIGDLVSLIELKIEECRGLTDLPKELGALVKLKHFSLSGCTGLRELPDSLGNLTSLTELDLSGTNIAKPPRMPLLHYVREIPLDTSNYESESDKTEGGEKATAWGTSKESCKQKMELEIHDELSHVSNVLDMANQPLVDEDDSYGVSGNVNRPLKHRRNDKGDKEADGGGGERVSQGDRDRGGGESVGETLTSLVLPHKKEKHEMESFFIESLQGKASPESNSNQGFRAMADYDDANEIVLRKKKRITQSGAAAAAAVAEGSEAHALSPGVGQHRRLWVKDRSKDWWERCNSPEFPEEEFRREFRMSKATFEFICNELDAVVTKNTMLRDAIPVRQRVAVCVWRLATGEPLRFLSKRFGLGISTCHKLVLEVCSAICDVLMPKFLQWPEEGRLAAIKQEFEAASGIPRVCGAMYTTHVPIIAPKNRVADYLNRRHTERKQKTTYTITVQGVVDPLGVFTDVCIGWPGSMPDDQVLEQSALHHRAGKGLLKDVWVVGNPGHPLMDWVLVPYTHQNITGTQYAFNHKLAEVQAVAREAFARLKGRWASLQKRTEVKLKDLPVMLGACCVLHNICEARNEAMDPEQRFEIFDDETVPKNPVQSAAAVQARDQIAHNLYHGLAGTSSLDTLWELCRVRNSDTSTTSFNTCPISFDTSPTLSDASPTLSDMFPASPTFSDTSPTFADTLEHSPILGQRVSKNPMLGQPSRHSSTDEPEISTH